MCRPTPPSESCWRRCGDTTLGAYAHQDLPFEKLVEELAPERQPALNPLPGDVRPPERAATGRCDLPGLSLQPVEGQSPQVRKFDMELHLWEQDGGLSASWVYNTALFDASTLERMEGHLLTLLADVARRPDCRVSELPLLSEAERQHLLVDFNATSTPFPEVCVHELFEAQAALTPHASALCFDDGQRRRRSPTARWTRAPTSSRTALRARGVGPEHVVAVCLERSAELSSPCSRVLKAGGAYRAAGCPPPPRARQDFMLQEARPTVLLTQPLSSRHFQRSTPSAVSRWMPTPSPSPRGAPRRPSAASRPDNLAYVIYTSGSTGQPKGVLVPHRGLVPLLSEHAPHGLLSWRSRPAVRFHQLRCRHGECGWRSPRAPRCAWAAATPWPPGEPLRAFLERQRITAAHVTPLRAGAPGRSRPARGCACCLIGGRGVPARSWCVSGRPGRRFFNVYGPTEVTIVSTLRRCEPSACRRPSVGLSPTRQAYVLDRHLQPVPLGVAGELYLGGVGVARGYLEPPGADGRALRSRPLRPRGAALPHRRPGAAGGRTGSWSSWAAPTTR